MDKQKAKFFRIAYEATQSESWIRLAGICWVNIQKFFDQHDMYLVTIVYENGTERKLDLNKSGIQAFTQAVLDEDWIGGHLCIW